MTVSDKQEQEILLKLYQKSILKKAKHDAISRYLPDPQGKVCLDVGADNGVLSYLFRQRGGNWHSADLDGTIVESIRRMVGDNVYLFDGRTTEFAEESFDTVVIIDFLEHIDTDKEFIKELSRIMKADGCLIVNVPHHKPHSLIRRLRLMVGLSDQKHGHVRPGYTEQDLIRLLQPEFEIRAHHTYSRFFVELFDIVVSLIFDRMDRGESTSKGVVVTADDMRKHEKKFKVFSVVYPFVWCLAQLDRLLFFTSGYSLITKARPVRAH